SNNFQFAPDGVLNTRMQMRAQVYLGPSLLSPSIKSINDVHMTNYINISLPKAGDIYHMYAYDRVNNPLNYGTFTLRSSLENASVNRREIDTKALSIQSYLLGNNIVGLLGWREDKQTTTAQAGTYYLADGSIDTSRTLVWGQPNPTETGRTFSWSLVGHTP